MKLKRSLPCFLMAFALWAPALLVGQSAAGGAHEGPTLPLREVTLFTSGVAEYVHRGTLGADGTISITIPRDRMADVVRSLTVVGASGNPVRDISFPAGEDHRRLLQRFRIDLNDVFDLAALVNAVRGAEVEVEHRAGRTVRGTVVGARPADQNREGSILLNTSDGAVSLEISTVTAFRFQDSRLDDEFAQALAILDGAAGPQAPQTLNIRMARQPATSSEEVTLRYLSEAPVWRTSYRGVFENGRLLLQGWAHIDNTGTADWDDVTLSIVSARPVTYLVDLYEPQYVNRDSGRSGTASGRAYPSAPAPSRIMAESFSADMAKSSVQIDLQEEELTAGLAFTFADGVSVPRGSSAMVPIVDRTFTAELVRSFDSRRDGRNPRLALSFRNESGRQLPPGVVTVYDGNRYAGDSMLPVLFDGAEAVLPYAVDMTHTVGRESDTSPEELRRVTVVDGTLVEEHRLRRTTRYNVTLSGTGRTQPIRITHEIPQGWSVVSPRPAESDGQDHVFNSSGSGITVIEERIREQRVALTSADQQQLLAYSSNRLIDPTVRRIVQNVVDLRSQLETHRRTRQEAERNLESVIADQQRIRENMQPLDRDSTLYRRYLRELETQENRLGMLREELEDARARENTADEALREYMRTLRN
jgi:hypothetical protein